MKELIQVTKSSMPSFEEFTNEIQDLWESGWLTNMGAKHKQLEMALERYLQVDNVNLFTNGHLALENAIASLNLSGEVITTPFTFVSTTHAIVRNRLTPVFCDINPDDYTIDTTKIESLITDKTSAIMPVHVYGNICDVDEIERIAKKHNLRVIYDAAHAFGVTKDDKGIGSFGDISMFSFHATKVFNTIEGGALTFNDDSLHSILNEQKNFGITGPEDIIYVGGNAKMNEFQAAMGLCNLNSIDDDIQRRKELVDRYNQHFNDIEGIKIVDSQQGVESNYAYYPVVFDGFKYTRDEVFENLKSENIHVRKYFFPLTNDIECYEGRFDVNETPVAKYISDRVLTLPLYPDLKLSDVDRICKVILN
ncbi:DegT/DnrJ/EryC1/StrS family aminotransferase [Oceanobacillus jeddahense]|uniref:DegT/DnrJ/EryC1/StrS family aminotransferase n=1 Tax=Oceanobacillus jeddahense TaxID=1462527 RepID=UPI000595AF49|nr:DegT/DnrJ/EryC1/StrS family aminotransferase [Oceanobacillus jeddahense]